MSVSEPLAATQAQVQVQVQAQVQVQVPTTVLWLAQRHRLVAPPTTFGTLVGVLTKVRYLASSLPFRSANLDLAMVSHPLVVVVVEEVVLLLLLVWMVEVGSVLGVAASLQRMVTLPTRRARVCAFHSPWPRLWWRASADLLDCRGQPLIAVDCGLCPLRPRRHRARCVASWCVVCRVSCVVCRVSCVVCRVSCVVCCVLCVVCHVAATPYMEARAGVCVACVQWCVCVCARATWYACVCVSEWLQRGGVLDVVCQL